MQVKRFKIHVSSFVVSCILHVSLAIILCVQFPYPTKKTNHSNGKDEPVLIEAIDISEYTNLALKYNENKNSKGNAQEKKHSSIEEDTQAKEESKNDTPAKKPTSESPTPSETHDVEYQLPSPIFPQKKIQQINPVKSHKPSAKPILKAEEELSGLLKSIDLVESKANNTSEGVKDGLIGKGEAHYDRRKPISQSMISSIKSQFIGCWNLPVGGFEMERLNVVVEVQLSDNGSVIDAKILNGATGTNKKNNKYFKAMADSALRSIYKCSPIIGLPIESYEKWQTMHLNFNAADIL